MAATDHLGPQFISTSTIGKLSSNNWRGHSVDEWHDAYRAGKRGSPAENDDGDEIPTPEFDRDIKKRGIQEPLIVDNVQNPTHLIEGHHRYSSAKAMGLKKVPIRQL
jgi:hypothetical protein